MTESIVLVVLSMAAGMLAGSEFAVAAIVHPNLSRLDDRSHARSVQALARAFGKYMPFWYALVLVLNLIALLAQSSRHTLSWDMLLTAAVLFAVSIVFSLTGPVPINNQVTHWDIDHLPSNWRGLRQRWDRLHAVRVAILLIALGCVLASVVDFS